MKKTVLLCCLMLISALAGCITDNISEKIDDGGLIANPNADMELVIVTYDISGLTDELLSNFENETGYSVELLKLDDAGSVLDHLLLNNGTQIADLALGLDNTYLQFAIDAGVFVEHNANISNISADALEPYNGPYAVPFDMGSICLNYDSAALDDLNMTAPESLWNLTESDWNGKVAIPSPITSSPGRAFMTATTDYFAKDADNETTWTDWWSSMVANDLIITSGWTEAYATHYSGGYGVWNDDHIGDAHITVSYCHSPGVEASFNGNSTSSVALALDYATFHQVEYAGVIDGGNALAANAFIEYLLSEEVNAKMPSENYMYPVIEGLDLPEADGYRYHSLVPNQHAEVTPEQIAANMETWLEQWNDAVSA